jgi:transposase
VKDIRRATRRHFSAEDKIRIVLDGLRGEDSIAELCRKEGIAQSLYYTWSKEFLEAGKRRLAGDATRAASSDDVKACARRPHQSRTSPSDARYARGTPALSSGNQSTDQLQQLLLFRTEAAGLEEIDYLGIG